MLTVLFSKILLYPFCFMYYAKLFSCHLFYSSLHPLKLIVISIVQMRKLGNVLNSKFFPMSTQLVSDRREEKNKFWLQVSFKYIHDFVQWAFVNNLWIFQKLSSFLIQTYWKFTGKSAELHIFYPDTILFTSSIRNDSKEPLRPLCTGASQFCQDLLIICMACSKPPTSPTCCILRIG